MPLNQMTKANLEEQHLHSNGHDFYRDTKLIIIGKIRIGQQHGKKKNKKING